ncbi:hypothetical protein [Gordonia araii]|nr:hypothetical protein [Gordonia araii]NNG96054.1 hypothetical protein [Gordonia araii NBRC 100433]
MAAILFAAGVKVWQVFQTDKVFCEWRQMRPGERCRYNTRAGVTDFTYEQAIGHEGPNWVALAVIVGHALFVIVAAVALIRYVRRELVTNRQDAPAHCAAPGTGPTIGNEPVGAPPAATPQNYVHDPHWRR